MIIDGIKVKSPDIGGLQCTPTPLWAENSGRAAGGKFTGDIIDYFWTISASWSRMNESELKLILSKVKQKNKPFYTVQTIDPETGTNINEKFYTGSISYVCENELAADRYYKDVNLTVVQQ